MRVLTQLVDKIDRFVNRQTTQKGDLPMIKLGSKVRDNITGFEGIAVSRVEFLHGCARICIQPQGLHEGKPIESQYFDEQQVELVEEKKVVVSEQSSAKTGGPYDAPTRHTDPVRRV